MRYLVRSYVTSPTTMSAITEIPANTPRPMGRTESFFPGMVKVALVVCWAAAAEGVPSIGTTLALVAGMLVGAAAGVVVGVEAEPAESPVGVAAEVTVETPLTCSGALGAREETAAVGKVDTVVVMALDVVVAAPAVSFDSLQFLTSSTA